MNREEIDSIDNTNELKEKENTNDPNREEIIQNISRATLYKKITQFAVQAIEKGYKVGCDTFKSYIKRKITKDLDNIPMELVSTAIDTADYKKRSKGRIQECSIRIKCELARLILTYYSNPDIVSNKEIRETCLSEQNSQILLLKESREQKARHKHLNRIYSEMSSIKPKL